ncbi:ABC transporter, partial [Reticulomyxa filosa]
YNNQDPQDIAEFWQGTLWLLLFTSMTCFQAWIGFKITIFSDDSTSMIVLFAIVVALCHLEIYACRLYIEDSTESDNKYFNPRIHTHALYLRTLRATCDLCWEKISKKGYRCSKCDFDVCKKCWKSGNQARAVAENQLRSDSGVSMSQDAEVGVMEYLTRLFEFYLPHRWWLLFGMICMSLNTYLELTMPSKKGKLLDLVLEMRWDAFVASIEKFVLFTIVSEALASIHKMIMNQSKEQKEYDSNCCCFLCSRIMAQDTVFFDGSSVGSLSERLEWGLRDMLAPFQTIVGSFIHDG